MKSKRVMMEKALNNVSSSSFKDADRRRIDSGKPIRFVYFDDNGNLKLHSDAIDLLQRIKGPVAVVSVFGPPRQGKSFILNQLLGKSSGFQIASTHQSCTKGLWMWSEPLKRIALDGTEYDLLLFDSGGINAYDQTGMHSTKMFTLAVLLSSMFIYNQVGLIDEAALEHLSLVTEMTKHIHTRASERNDSISKFEYSIPVFMWLLRDFYLDLVVDNSRITPHSYLTHALRPMLDGGKDIATKTQIRESIRAVFPNQECFTLVRPLNNETDLQHLDQVSLDQFRPEFRSGLDVFMKFIYERTRPKQVGGSAVTGPFLAIITNFLLDVLNDSTVPTIPSWQIRARDAIMEADSHCLEVIKSMETRLQEACQVDARLEHVAEVLESLLSDYEASVHGGPTKWQKLSSFLQKSLQGPILLHAKKLIDQISSEKSSLLSKCCSNEDKIELLHKQLEASHKLQAEYESRYDDAIKDFKKVSDQYKNRIIELEQKYNILEERCSSSLEKLDSAKQDSLQWERKYEGLLAEKGADNEQVNAKTAVLGYGVCEEPAKIAAAAESLQLALKEAHEWKQKYDNVVNESKAALEEAAEQARHREEALIAKFNDSAAESSQLALKEAHEWKEKYDTIVNESNAALEKAAEQARHREGALIAKITDSAAASSHLALKEAHEWEEKYDTVVNESKAALEKAAEQARHGEEALIAKFTDSAAESSQLALKEVHEWKEKYDTVVNESKAALEKEAEQARHREESLIAKFTDSAAESLQFALKEAREWKEKHDTVVNESKAALEKEAEQARHREEALIAKFTDSLAEKDKENKEMVTKVEDSEQRLTSLTFDLKAAEIKIENYDSESSALKLQIKELAEKYEFVKASNQSMEKEIKMLAEDRIRLEEKCLSELKRLEEAQDRLKVSEEKAKIEPAQMEGFSAQTVNTETMETGKEDLPGEAERSAASVDDSMLKIALLEAMVRGKDQEIELLKKKCEQFLSSTPVKDGSLESTSDYSEESIHFRGPKTYSGNKRSRLQFSGGGHAKARSRSALQKCTTSEVDSGFKVEEGSDEYQDVGSSVDYTKLTVVKLRKELQEHGFGWELRMLKQPKKKDILDLYRTLVLK